MIKLITALTFLLVGFLGLSEFSFIDSKQTTLQPINPNLINEQIDYKSFVQLTKDLESYREERRISVDTFFKYAEEPNTIILDTRSKAAFDESHLEGAVHLNFSDFTKRKLKKVIPSKKTRILIYCNNNFTNKSLPKHFAENDFEAIENAKINIRQKEIASLVMKSPPLALNIPTFINLYGYGYENIYEMESILTYDYPKLVINNEVMESEE